MSDILIGPARNRVDGRLKVTGAAKYSVEFDPPHCAWGWPVESSIGNGRISSIDTTAAQAAPGVLAVLTHLNAPKTGEPNVGEERSQVEGIRNEHRLPLADDQIHYAGQYIALVVADTRQNAEWAASLVQVKYAPQSPVLISEKSRKSVEPEKSMGEDLQVKKGDVEKAFKDASLVKMEAVYVTPVETHNPIETSGTIAVWDDAQHLTLYDATQFVKGVQGVIARANGLPVENVRVICPFVGGAFGCKGAVWPHVQLAVMGARVAGVPVRVHLHRRHMFVGTGHRTATKQTLTLAADRDGKLQALRHDTETQTSPVGQFIESCGVRSSGVMYKSASIRIKETIHEVNIATPTFMRAPGECPGTYALECAMDELAVALRMDPVALRVVNHADNHPTRNIPYSAKHLKEAYQLGAERFGWARRNPEPRSMRDGNLLVGWGMATATYPAHKMKAAVKVLFRADGNTTVQCASHDLGTGAYTAFTQISSELLGIPFEAITFELGRSDLPFGPVAGGSNSTATVGTAIHEAATLFHQALAELAVKDSKSPLFQARASGIVMVEPGRIGMKDDVSRSDSYTDILKRAGRNALEVQSEAKDPKDESGKKFQSWGADFCEVKIDPALPRVQVTRVVTVMNCGRIVSAKTARSQILGGVVMGIGMALMEETLYDPATGLPVTRNLADYHVPTNLDAPEIDVQFVGEPDFAFNPIGARGLGEIGITGIAAAVANAVYHATGRRIRELPITPDKLL